MKIVAESGARYRAAIHLGWAESFASNDTVADKIREAGLTDVTVWGSGHERVAEGTWPGETQEVELPDQITQVTKIS